MFIYPWGDMHSLNLGWFLMQFKEWVEKIQEYLDNGGGTSENLANVIAPVFNAENSYLTGDYVLYNDELYKALEPVPPGTWNPDAWERCLVTEEMGSASSGVDNVARLMIAGQYSNTYNYQKYAICRYADKLWMCNTNIPAGGEEWEPTHWDEITVGAGLTGLRRSVETLSQAITALQDAINTITDDVSDLSNKFPVSIANGGTGETTLANAKAAFGISDIKVSVAPVPHNTATTIVCENNARGLLVMLGTYGIILTVEVTSVGGVSIKQYGESTAITISTITNGIVVTNSSAANLGFYCIDFNNCSYSTL